jgi:predicted transcriptional regulator
LISIVDILKSISDDKGLILFNTIALANGESEIQIRKMGLTSKQFYSRISKLTKADLIKRKYGRYSLTVLGRVVYEAHTTIGKALMCYWKLKAIESIETSPSIKLPKDDLAKLVDTLIDNQQIKDILRNTSNLNDDHHPREVSQDIMTGAKKLQLGELITNKLK